MDASRPTGCAQPQRSTATWRPSMAGRISDKCSASSTPARFCPQGLSFGWCIMRSPASRHRLLRRNRYGGSGTNTGTSKTRAIGCGMSCSAKTLAVHEPARWPKRSLCSGRRSSRGSGSPAWTASPRREHKRVRISESLPFLLAYHKNGSALARSRVPLSNRDKHAIMRRIP